MKITIIYYTLATIHRYIYMYTSFSPLILILLLLLYLLIPLVLRWCWPSDDTRVDTECIEDNVREAAEHIRAAGSGLFKRSQHQIGARGISIVFNHVCGRFDYYGMALCFFIFQLMCSIDKRM